VLHLSYHLGQIVQGKVALALASILKTSCSESRTQYYFACEDLRKSGFGGEHADSNHRLM
jgi:hypothetical protein